MSKAGILDSHVARSGRLLPDCVIRVLGDLRGRVDGEPLALGCTEKGQVRSVEEGGVLRHWNVKTGGLLFSTYLSDTETCWAFSEDGTRLASGSNGLAIWDAQTGDLIQEHPEQTWMTNLAVSPDGSIVASGHDDFKVRLWDTRTGKLVHVLNGHQDEISALSFSSDGACLASAAEDRMVRLWDVRRGSHLGTLEGHTDRVDDLAWSPSGHRLASAAWDTSVRVWDPRKRELLALLNGHSECVHAVRFTGDGKGIISADSEGRIRLWDYAKLKVRAEVAAHTSAARRLVVRPDGKQVCTGGADRAIQFLSLPGLEPLSPASPQSNVLSLCPVGKNSLAVVHAEGTLTTYDIKSGRAERSSLEDGPVRSAASTPSSGWAFGRMDGTIGYVALSSSSRTTRAWSGHADTVRLLAMHPRRAEIASSDGVEGTIRVWNSSDGEIKLIIPEATFGGTLEAMAFHPTLPLLAAVGVDWRSPGGPTGAVVLWDVERIKLDRMLSVGGSACTFSPDGRYLAVISVADHVVVWSLAKFEVVAEIDVDSSCNAILFDPRSRFLIVGGDDGGVRVWSTESWRMESSIDLETRIRALAFAADGEYLVTGNANSACYMIEMSSLAQS